MKLPQSRLTAQGQISIPAAVRRRLELAPGAVLEWEVEDDRITVRRAGQHTSEELHDVLFSTPPAPRTLKELKDGLGSQIRARHARR